MLRRILRLVQFTFQIWSHANSSRMAAAMTYYMMLSLAPLLMIAIAFAGYLFDDGLIEAEIVDRVATFTSEGVAETVASLIKNATNEQQRRPNSGLIAGGISLLVLFYAASGVFTQLYDTFNEIWQVPKEKRSGLRFTVKERLFGVSMVLVAGVFLLASMFLSASIEGVNDFVRQSYPQALSWLRLLERSISFFIIPFVLSLLFWLVPATKVHWQDVWLAAMLTAFLLFGSRYLIQFYLRFSSANEVYGSAGSLVVLLVWVYITGLVVFFGAAFSHAWARTFGSQSGFSRSVPSASTEIQEDAR